MLSASEKQQVANEMTGRRKMRLITDLSGSRTPERGIESTSNWFLVPSEQASPKSYLLQNSDN